ncbi:MAG: hypothetical protein QNJ14_18555 [Woeseiaceae bacterium]|nr:hypothetical protein [Woeseiaceae bacterium]
MITENELLKLLRDEATEMKACFTRYAFQSITASLVVIGVVVRTQDKYPQMGIVSALVIIFLLAVMRIGIYKYYGANRIYGFELHLARMNSITENASGVPKEKLTNISWEEAMRAWRIVQPTIFAALYDVKEVKSIRVSGAIPRLKPEYRNKRNQWFRVDSLIDEDCTYHSGSYLRTIFSIMMIIIALCILSIIYMPIQVLISDSSPYYSMSVFTVLVSLFLIYVAQQRLTQMRERRRLLEDEIHSIHSCGIAWHFVIVAHYRALNDLADNNSDFIVRELKGYSAALSKHAKSLVPHLKQDQSIYDWL